MNVDISKILNGVSISTEFDMDVTFNEEDLNRLSIISLDDAHVTGKVTKLDDDLYDISFNLKGVMILPDAVTLENVPYKFDINEENEYEIGEKLKISENLLDIYEVLWENVVLEVPLRVTKDDSDVVLEGNGWSLNKEVINNSGLEGLKNLLDMEDEK